MANLNRRNRVTTAIRSHARIVTSRSEGRSGSFSKVVQGVNAHNAFTCEPLYHSASRETRRGPPDNAVHLVDLRQLNTRQLSPLLEEESQVWRDELHWDYHVSIELIKKFLDSHSLAGFAAIEENSATGYGFYVIEEHKGLLGDLFVSPSRPQAEVGELLLREIVETLRAIPFLQRIEAQLMPFGSKLGAALSSLGFSLYPRQFMILNLANGASVRSGAPAGFRIENWDERHFASCADLIHRAYADHVDGEINDQYRSREGAMKFLKNIVLLPGCGQFEQRASFVLYDQLNARLAGVVLTSMVAKGTGHTTQLCVLPEYRGRGLGKQLMSASIDALRRMRATELSLTVTSNNKNAVDLYDKLGFRTLKSFLAGVWSAV